MSTRNILFLVAFGISLFLSAKFYYFRWIGYELIPSVNAILDERNYALAGLTLRQTGIPTSWSNLNSYKILSDAKLHPALSFNGQNITGNSQLPSLSNIREFNYPVTYATELDRGQGKEHILFVQPFLDHSPLSGLIYSLGINPINQTYDQLQPGQYRLFALYFSTITGILIFLLSYIWHRNVFISLFALIIYSTAPTYILSSRLALTENLLIPLSLVSLIFVSLALKENRDNRKYQLLFLSGIFSGLAILTKEIGITSLITGITLIILSRPNAKRLFTFSLPAVIIGSLFSLYSFFVSPELTVKLLSDQANRAFFGPLNILSSIQGPRFAGFPLDGFWFWGIASVILLAKDFKENKILLIGLLAALVCFVFFGGANYPWYYLPFIPYLVIGSALSLNRILTKRDISALILFLVFAFSSAFYWGYFLHHPLSQGLALYRLFSVGFIFLAMFARLPLPDIFKNISSKTSLAYQVNFPLFNKADKFFWQILVLTIFYQVYKWNTQGFTYIIGNWSKLPEMFFVK